MTPRDAASETRLLALWSGTPPGTRVVVRRDDGTRFAARTASAPWMLGHVAVVDVNHDLSEQSVWALSRVSRAEPLALVPKPAVTIAAALDPVPSPPDPVAVPFDVLFTLAAMAYAATVGLLAIVAAVFQ